MGAKTFTTVALPDELIAEVDKLIDKKELGYRNRAEILKDAVRKLLLEIKNSKKR